MLGFSDIIVKAVEFNVRWKNLLCDLVHFTLPLKTHTCPVCSQKTNHVHDYRKQYIKHITVNNQMVLVYRKRRYKCPNCDKKFYENNTIVERYQRKTTQLNTRIMIDILESNFTSAARRSNISNDTARRLFNRLYTPKYPELPEVLCIDEFKGDTYMGKFQFMLIDGKNSDIIDIHYSRDKDKLYDYFTRKYTEKALKNVKFVVMDMYQPYRKLVKRFFPEATIICDKFHFVRLANKYFESIRRNYQNTLPKYKRDKLKRRKNRRLLLTPSSRLTVKGALKIDDLLNTFPELLVPYSLKDSFLNIVTDNDYDHKTIQQKLRDWIEIIEHSDCDDLKPMAQTIQFWFEEIINAYKYPYSNGKIEGLNNKVKVIKRNGYGYKKFSTFKNLIMYKHNENIYKKTALSNIA